LLRRLFAFVIAVGLAWCATDQDRIWSDYIEWYRRQPVSVTDLRAPYIDYLKSTGIAEAEIQERARIVERLSRERREELHPAFFDRTYASDARFNTEPNALLAEAVRGVKPGRALDIDMGQGRNSVFLAGKGWDVTGFDFSAEGVRAANQAAAKAGVRITAVKQRHEDFDFGRDKWDLILMSYTWVPLREPFVTRIIDSLKPGGLLVFEHMMDESGSERAAAWLPGPNGLLQVFGRLRILRYEDTRAQADWSWRPERLARLVAQK
jgi:SAM-dependent methyltransferase